MAATLTYQPQDQDYWGKHRREVYQVVGDASYPAGGMPITPATIAMGNISGARVIGSNLAAAKLIAQWDRVNKKLMVLYPSGGAAASPAALADPVQGTATVDNHASGQTVTARLSGANTITTWLDATALSDTPALVHTVSAPGNGVPGQGKEVLAATDLTSCTWFVEFIGN